MPLVFYYLSLSPPARSVDLVIHALGLSAEYRVVDTLNKEQFKPDFLKLNPIHTIPLIIDDGFILWESHAIMAYLVSKYAKDDCLYPKDQKKRAIVDQRMHYHNDVFYLLRSIIRKILYGNLRVLTDSHIQQVREVQINLEKLLEGNKYMGGDSLTLADYSFITLVDILEAYLPMENKFPLIKAWEARCKTSMKNFKHVNEKGAADIVAKIRDKMSSMENLF
ncbi:glutathione S-transferase D7-like isoform X2 [Macrosteles quadrilineatus]|nr:glutathione S-transferase D7-like isoform X2 [Macrosteles quadrilineatus]